LFRAVDKSHSSTHQIIRDPSLLVPVLEADPPSTGPCYVIQK